MNVLGADIATTSGLAILNGVKLVHGEAFRPRGADDAEIFHGFRVHFRALLVSHEVEAVAIEQPLPTNIEINDPKEDERTGNAGHRRNPVTMATYLRLYGLFGHAQEICYALNITPDVVHQATWRKAFTGDGKADKDRSLHQCKLLGYPVKSKDLAEAVGVAWWLNGKLGLQRTGELALGKPGEAA